MNKDAFKTRVFEWAKKLDVNVISISVRPMRNKWASCSTNGRLNFSEEVLQLTEDLRDYIVVHELLHFSVPNHGKLWKSLMLTHVGDYEDKEKQLREIVSATRSANRT